MKRINSVYTVIYNKIVITQWGKKSPKLLSFQFHLPDIITLCLSPDCSRG